MSRALLLMVLLVLVACKAQTGPGANGLADNTTAAPIASPSISGNAIRMAGETAVPGTTATRIPADKYQDLDIVTLLPPDAIPAVNNPQFLTVAEADAYYDADELVIGVVFDGDARAYSVPYLSDHEIVNDNVAAVKIAVTW